MAGYPVGQQRSVDKGIHVLYNVMALALSHISSIDTAAIM